MEIKVELFFLIYLQSLMTTWIPSGVNYVMLAVIDKGEYWKYSKYRGRSNAVK